MLSCKELVARSSDFLDGQLDFRGQLAVRSHLLMCRHCRRFIRQMRLTQATVRHLPEGRGRNSTVWPRISPNCARTPRGAEPGYPRHQAAARDSWAAAFRFRYPAWANRTRPGMGGSPFRVTRSRSVAGLGGYRCAICTLRRGGNPFRWASIRS